MIGRGTVILACGFISCIASPVIAQLKVEKRADLSQPVTLGPDQGAIVLGFRRPDKMSSGKSGSVAFARYDIAKRDVIFQPRDAKKKGDTTTYWVVAASGDRKLPLDHDIMVVTAGDYVLFGATPGPGLITNSFCLGAPTFTVKAGEAVYVGDFTPYIMAKMADGRRGMAMAYSVHPDDAAKALEKQPDLAGRLKLANIRDGATFACAAQEMTAYIAPGAPILEPVVTPAEAPPQPAAATH
jgi:hypothetical protein